MVATANWRPCLVKILQLPCEDCEAIYEGPSEYHYPATSEHMQEMAMIWCDMLYAVILTH